MFIMLLIVNMSNNSICFKKMNLDYIQGKSNNIVEFILVISKTLELSWIFQVINTCLSEQNRNM